MRGAYAEGWYVYNQDRSLATGFEVCGADGIWRKGKILNLDGSAGRIKGRDVVVSADGLSGPRKLRYLHSHPWFGALYSDACLPLGAFHIGEP